MSPSSLSRLHADPPNTRPPARLPWAVRAREPCRELAEAPWLLRLALDQPKFFKTVSQLISLSISALT